MGEKNSTQIVTLEKPTVIRCLAGGYPKPYVSWWRDTEMLPLKTARFEVNRDYSLVFNSVGLADLGPYVCQAYSGYGKPKSISVTLKAVGPVHTNDPLEQNYLQYIIDPSQVPIAAPPSYKPLRPLPRVESSTSAPAPPRNGKWTRLKYPRMDFKLIYFFFSAS